MILSELFKLLIVATFKQILSSIDLNLTLFFNFDIDFNTLSNILKKSSIFFISFFYYLIRDNILYIYSR